MTTAPRTPARFTPRLAPALLLVTTIGCTAIPQHNLTAFRESFDALRRVSEQITLDDASRRTDRDALTERIERGRGNRRPRSADDPATLGLAFDAHAESTTASVDGITARLLAWETAGRYVQTLAALAEGRTPREIDTHFDGLIMSLQTFPSEAVENAALDLAPYGDALKPALAAMRHERDAQRFRTAVMHAAPLMNAFFTLLIEDAQTFWNARATPVSYTHLRAHET